MSSGEMSQVSPFTSVDAQAGVLWTFSSLESTISSDNGKLIQIGLSVSHLTSPKLTFFNVPDENYYYRYLVHGMGSIGINNSSMAIRPSFLYQS